MREIKFRAWNQRRWLHSWEVAITAEGKVILYEPQDECWFFIDELSYEIQGDSIHIPGLLVKDYPVMVRIIIAPLDLSKYDDEFDGDSINPGWQTQNAVVELSGGMLQMNAADVGGR